MVCSTATHQEIHDRDVDARQRVSPSSYGGIRLAAFRQKDLSPLPPLLRGEGDSNEASRKHEKDRQECLPHHHTHFLNVSRIRTSDNDAWKVERTFLSARIHQPEAWKSRVRALLPSPHRGGAGGGVVILTRHIERDASSGGGSGSGGSGDTGN